MIWRKVWEQAEDYTSILSFQNIGDINVNMTKYFKILNYTSKSMFQTELYKLDLSLWFHLAGLRVGRFDWILVIHSHMMIDCASNYCDDSKEENTRIQERWKYTEYIETTYEQNLESEGGIHFLQGNKIWEGRLWWYKR